MPEPLDTPPRWRRLLLTLAATTGAVWIFGAAIFYILRMAFLVYFSGS